MNAPNPVHAGEADRWGGWSWREASRGEHFRRCSYCGSMHPDDLAAEIPVMIDWADQKYGWPHKFYVHVPNRQPDALFVIGSANFRPAGTGYIEWNDLTPEQLAVCERDGYLPKPNNGKPDYVQFGTRAEHFGKFYTIHLADPDISDDTKQAIARLCGIEFEFNGGRVGWKPAVTY